MRESSIATGRSDPADARTTVVQTMAGRAPDRCALRPTHVPKWVIHIGKGWLHTGEAADKEFYGLEPEEDRAIPTVCHSLDMALEKWDMDRTALKAGGVW
jgi:hypothetical protein